MSHNSRIATNTLLLYIRMVIVMFVNLITVRVVLNGLGETGYGVYNAVAGVVTMLSCVTTVLASATQRFYSCAMGDKTIITLQKIFSASINIYVIFAFVVLLLTETIGLWFINSKLTIPSECYTSANYIYQFSIITFIVTLFQVPFSAAVITHEDMKVFAFISLAECILKFFCALIMLYINTNRMLFYGLYLLIIPIISFTIYYKWSKKNYKECNYIKFYDKQLHKEILSFSGWNLLSSLAAVGMNQMNIILVNIFFGPITNATITIAFQIGNALKSLSGSFLLAIRPPIIKSYADCNYYNVNKLFNISNKFIIYLMLLVCIPLYINMDSILMWWLGKTDGHTILFSRLVLIYVFVLVLNDPITFIIYAIGKIKEYTIPVETITLLCVPVTYLLYKIGFPAEYAVIVMIISTIIAHIVRMVCLKKYYPYFLVKSYLLDIIGIGVINLILIYFASSYVSSWFVEPFSRLLYSLIVCTFLCLLLGFVLGLKKDEKQGLISLISKVLTKKG